MAFAECMQVNKSINIYAFENKFIILFAQHLNSTIYPVVYNKYYQPIRAFSLTHDTVKSVINPLNNYLACLHRNHVLIKQETNSYNVKLRTYQTTNNYVIAPRFIQDFTEIYVHIFGTPGFPSKTSAVPIPLHSFTSRHEVEQHLNRTPLFLNPGYALFVHHIVLKDLETFQVFPC